MSDFDNRRRRWRLAMADGPRALGEIGALAANAPLLRLAPRGDGHPVVVLPGFGGSDRGTGVMREYLSQQGHDARPWDLGRNRGLGTPDLRARLVERLHTVYQSAGRRKVSLVGWSLGGVYARALAQRFPDKVRHVVTLGSPIGADGPLPGVPSTAVFSKSDAVVPWRMAVQNTGELAENIEVFGSHMGLGFNPAVFFALADRLALPEGRFRKFHRNGWRAWVYGPARVEQEADEQANAW